MLPRRLVLLLVFSLVLSACMIRGDGLTSAYTAVEGAKKPIPREVSEQRWVPFAEVGGITVHHPADRVERLAYHESNNDGAQNFEPVTTDTRQLVLASRGRGNGPRTAVDIVVHPEAQIRSPVTGRVLRAGSYTLYCDHTDDFVVIEPDGQPGWELKVLHMEGIAVRPGDRVVAGRSFLAPRARLLPFDSQVDEFTAEPSWPHVHIEMVDPSIPDRPGAGCP